MMGYNDAMMESEAKNIANIRSSSNGFAKQPV